MRAVRAWGERPCGSANRPPAHTVIPQCALPAGDRRRRHLGRPLGGGVRSRLCGAPARARGRCDRRAGGACRSCWPISKATRNGAPCGNTDSWRSCRTRPRAASSPGGILDMIAVKHTPVRAVPRQHLTEEALAGATMAVDVDADSLTPSQKDVLKQVCAFGRHGADRSAGMEGLAPRRQPHHARQERARPAERYLARREFDGGTPQPGSAGCSTCPRCSRTC